MEKISGILKEDLEYTFEKLSGAEVHKMKNSTLLLTGCAGFTGYYLIHFFRYYADRLNLKKIICLDNFMCGRPEWLDNIEDERFIVKAFDITNDRIEEIDGSENVDFVIHMESAVLHIRPIESVDAEIWGLRKLLDFYAEKKLKGFLYFSSSSLYGEIISDAVPVDEEYKGFVSATGKRAYQDEAKRFGETLCMLFANQYHMPIGVARPFNHYGPGMELDSRDICAGFAKKISEGKDIVIYSNEIPTGTFCYIADAAAGYLKILLYGKYDYFNIGIDKPEITEANLAKIYEDAGREIFGYEGKVVCKISEYWKNAPERKFPKTDKARRLLEYDPEIYARQGVYRFLRFIKENIT